MCRNGSDDVTLQWKQGVPVEVAPFAYVKVLQNLRTLGSEKASLRMAKMKAGPIVSDNGNFVIDAPFPEEQMKDPFTVGVLAGISPDCTMQLICTLAAFGAHQDAHRRCGSRLVLPYGKSGLLRKPGM